MELEGLSSIVMQVMCRYTHSNTTNWLKMVPERCKMATIITEKWVRMYRC